MLIPLIHIFKLNIKYTSKVKFVQDWNIPPQEFKLKSPRWEGNVQNNQQHRRQHTIINSQSRSHPLSHTFLLAPSCSFLRSCLLHLLSFAFRWHRSLLFICWLVHCVQCCCCCQQDEALQRQRNNFLCKQASMSSNCVSLFLKFLFNSVFMNI